MKIETLISKQDSINKGLEIHPLYDYPITCLRCSSNISVDENHKDLFKCECRFYTFNYPCGVHLN